MTGSCQARRLDSDGAGLDRGAESRQESIESHRNLPQPFPTLHPQKHHARYGCPHIHNPDDNFRVFELPHPQGPDLDPTSMSFKLSDLGQMTCSL